MPMLPIRKDDNAYARAAGLGVVTGMRSMLPLALLSAALQPGGAVGGYSPARGDTLAGRLLATPKGGIVTGIAAIGEVVNDKLPITPGRNEPPLIAERLIVGAIVGGVVCQLGGRSPLVGAAIGSTASIAASFAGYYGRTILPRVTGIPQQIWGVAEDAIAVTLGAKTLGLRWR